MKCSWIRRLHNRFHRDWKIILLDYMNSAVGNNFKFHSNLSIPNETINSLPSYYKDITDSWYKYHSCTPKVPSLVSLQFLWSNSYIKIDKVVFYKDFGVKLVSLTHFLHDFWRGIFLTLYSNNWPNFIDEVMSFEINLNFLNKPFSYSPKKSGQYLRRNKKHFLSFLKDFN